MAEVAATPSEMGGLAVVADAGVLLPGARSGHKMRPKIGMRNVVNHAPFVWLRLLIKSLTSKHLVLPCSITCTLLCVPNLFFLMVKPKEVPEHPMCTFGRNAYLEMHIQARCLLARGSQNYCFTHTWWS